MSYFLFINEVAAVVAIALLSLVARGFLPHISAQDRRAALLTQFMFVALAISGIRTAYYDLWRSFARYTGLIDVPDLRLSSQILNFGFDVMIAWGCWRALKALHLSLPEADQRHYNWLTAPFHPSSCVMIFRRAKD